MGRWTQYEEDSERLPTGMKRIGYDADTQKYTFQDEKGVLYESEPGNAYGTLRPVIERDIRKARPNAFESPKKPTSTNSSHSRSTSTPHTTLQSFQDFLPSSAITSPPNPPNNRNNNPSSPSSSDSRLPDVFSKVKSMTSAVSRFQISNRPLEGGGKYHHLKSPSLPISSLLSGLHKSERFSPQPPVPPKTSREYTLLRKEVEEDELKKRLFRSKTSVHRSSAITPPSSALGSKTHSSVYRSTSISSSRPRRTTSQASRISSVSTTSTITPMKTT